MAKISIETYLQLFPLISYFAFGIVKSSDHLSNVLVILVVKLGPENKVKKAIDYSFLPKNVKFILIFLQAIISGCLRSRKLNFLNLV
jgi:hypothetical protein